MAEKVKVKPKSKSKPNLKGKPSPKGKPSVKENNKQSADKKFVVNSSPKVVKKDRSNIMELDDNITLPTFSESPSSEVTIDMFLVDLLNLSDKKDLVSPHFIGDYSRVSYSDSINASSVGIDPSDKVKFSSDVVSLNRKG